MTAEHRPDPDDLAAVTALLGRAPAGRFVVVVRRPDGSPVVIRNAPMLEDGTPMPTLFWLVDPDLSRQVARLESGGAIRRLGAVVDPAALQRAHDRYAAAREALIDPSANPRPTGGVGGARAGVKCLHAHLANFLAGDDDPVGALAASELELGSLVLGPPDHGRL